MMWPRPPPALGFWWPHGRTRGVTCRGAQRGPPWCRGWRAAASARGHGCSVPSAPGPASLQGDGTRCGVEMLEHRPPPVPPSPSPSPSLTDGGDELVKVPKGDERLRQLAEEQLEGTGDDVDVLPAPVVQVQVFLCGDTGTPRTRDTHKGGIWGHPGTWAQYRDPLCSAASGWWPGCR